MTGNGLSPDDTPLAGVHVGAVEQRVAKHVLGVEDKPVAHLPIDAELVKRLVGNYQLGEGKVEITVEDGKLYATPAGQPKDRLKYQGQGQFVSATNPDIRVTFTTADGQAEGFEVEMEGRKLTARRAL